MTKRPAFDFGMPHLARLLLDGAVWCLFALWVCHGFVGSVVAGERATDSGIHTVQRGSEQRTGFLPKAEIGALDFLQRNPTADGRGVIVAIWDTGIDPAAAGLQTTPGGRPKCVDFIDATGDGDVPLELRELLPTGKLLGQTGRLLTVNPRWKNPTGQYWIGWKAGYKIFPDALVSRLQQHRQRDWRHALTRYEAKVRQNSAATNKAETSARLELLRSLRQTPNAPGPIHDCVVFHNGQHYCSVIDTDEDGDLRDEQVLSDFRVQRDVGRFPDPISLAFTVRFQEAVVEKTKQPNDVSKTTGEPPRLSLVTTSGSHGTHVAGIVGAYYPQQPALSGVAPGVQFVSIKIGDERLGAMETGRALVRAARATLDSQAQMVNMSYGEPTATPNRGAVTEVLRDLVREHNVLFVASAGNSGPALTTVGAPGGTSSDIVGVGAYAPPALMRWAYSHPDELTGRAYSWTSCGPAADGHLGVDIFAPGGAVAPVPTWTRNKSARMNGTSMASPSACGGLALLVSDCLQSQRPYTPAGLMQIVKQTCKPIPNVSRFAQGRGLLQVHKAAELLRLCPETGQSPVVEVSLRGPRGGRGILLREPAQTRTKSTHRVRLRPHFSRKTADRTRIDYEQLLSLRSSADWVRCGGQVLLTERGRDITVHVDPTRLPPGVHFAEIELLDSPWEAAANGKPKNEAASRPLLVVGRIPVTVLVPANRTVLASARKNTFASRLRLQPGTSDRLFLQVPSNARTARVRLQPQNRSAEMTTGYLHTSMGISGRNPRDLSVREAITLRSGHPLERTFTVQPGRLWEVCLSQWWWSAGQTDVDVEIEFSGLTATPSPVVVTAGGSGCDVLIEATTGREVLAASAEFTHLRRDLAPNDHQLFVLSAHEDRLLTGETPYRLALQYTLSPDLRGRVRFSVPAVEDLLYDGPLLSVFVEIQDAAGQRIFADDSLPDVVSLGRGEHTVEVLLRASSSAALEPFKQTRLRCLKKLSSAIVPPVRWSFASNSTETAERKPRRLTTPMLRAGQQVPVHVTAPTLEDLPRLLQPGDVLTGRLHLQEKTFQSDTNRTLDSVPLLCLISAEIKAKRSPLAVQQHVGGSSRNSPRSIRDDWQQQIHAAQVAALKRLSSPNTHEQFEKAAFRLLKRQPNRRDVLVARLQHLDLAAHRKGHLDEVITAADKVLNLFDLDAVRLATASHSRSAAKTAKAQQAAADRKLIVDTLYRKGRALGYQTLPDVLVRKPLENPEEHARQFEANFAELARWVDTTDSAYVLLHVRWERRQGLAATAIRRLNHEIKSQPPNYWLHKKRRDLYRDLGWILAAEREQSRIVIGFPNRPPESTLSQLHQTP